MNQMMYLDDQSKEIENILNGSKDIIIRAANIKKFPFRMISEGDTLYLLRNNAKGIAHAKVNVKKAVFIEIKNQSQMEDILNQYESRVLLRKQKVEYIKKRKYVSIFVIDAIEEVYGKIDHSLYGMVEDWVQFIPLRRGIRNE